MKLKTEHLEKESRRADEAIERFNGYLNYKDEEVKKLAQAFCECPPFVLQEFFQDYSTLLMDGQRHSFGYQCHADSPIYLLERLNSFIGHELLDDGCPVLATLYHTDEVLVFSSIQGIDESLSSILRKIVESGKIVKLSALQRPIKVILSHDYFAQHLNIPYEYLNVDNAFQHLEDCFLKEENYFRSAQEDAERTNYFSYERCPLSEFISWPTHFQHHLTKYLKMLNEI